MYLVLMYLEEDSVINKTPLLSIITVVFNGVKYIEETIESVISQKEFSRNIEYIIIDGGSTDGTLNVIETYRDKIHVFISEPDKGIYDAMNKGLMHARGRFVGFINSDDFYMQNALDKVILLINRVSDNISVIYGNMYMIDANSKEILQHRKPVLWKLNIDMNLSHPATFIRRTTHMNYKYSLKYKISSDYDCLLRMKKSGIEFIKLNETISSMRDAGVSATQNAVALKESREIKKYYNGYIINSLASIYLKLVEIKKLIK
ncbi:Hyaluronan synthase [compost metagenome]